MRATVAILNENNSHFNEDPLLAMVHRPCFTSRDSPAMVQAQDRRAPLAEHAAVGAAAVGHVVLVGQVAHVQRELGARAERIAQRQVGQGR